MQNSFKRENLDFYLAISLGIIAMIFIIYWNGTHPRLTVRYDCSISEIHPDYPIEVKEGCRKLRAESFNKDLQKPK